MRTVRQVPSRVVTRNTQFRLAIHALVLRLGGRPGGLPLYELILDTPLGELALSPVDSDIGPWLACRFRDVASARQLHDARLNPFSGKWNFMDDDLAAIERALVKVLAFPSDGLDESSVPQKLAA